MPSIEEQEAFIRTVTPSALAARDDWGILASVAVAQACLESNYGHNLPAPFNVLGLKDLTFDAGSGRLVKTGEFGADGQHETIRAGFEDFRDFTHCFMVYGRLLARSPTYEPYRRALPDAQRAVEALERVGYSTNPQYAEDVMAVWRKHRMGSIDAME